MARRIAALTVLLALALTGSALAGALCVSLPGFCALIDREGGEILPAGRFQAIIELSPDALYAAGQPGAYRLYDDEGQLVGEETFAMACADGVGLIFARDGLYGYMSARGEVLLEPVWTQLVRAEDGWLALDQDPLDDQSDELLRIEANGEVVRTGVYVANGLTLMRCGRMPYRASDGRCGAVNARGERVIAPDWRYIGPFIDDMALVTGETGRGMIDTDGRTVIEPEYLWLERNESLILGQRSDGGADVYRAKDAQLLYNLPGPLSSVSLAGSCAVMTGAGASHLYNREGQRVATASTQAVFAPGVGGQVIISDGAWGEACQYLVNPDGTVPGGRYQRLLPLGDSRYAYMVMDGAEYYSAELRAFQKSWDYDSQRYGLLSDAGECLTEALYRQILSLGEERLLLIDDEVVRLSDLNGNVLRQWLTAADGSASAEAGGAGID